MSDVQRVVEGFHKDVTSIMRSNNSSTHEISDFSRYYSENPKKLAEMREIEQKIRKDETNLRREEQSQKEARKELEEKSGQLDNEHKRTTGLLDNLEAGIKEQTSAPESLIQGNIEHLERIRRNVASELDKLTSSDAYAARAEDESAWAEKQEKYQEKLLQFDKFLQSNKEDLAKWRIAQIETIMRESKEYRPPRDNYKFPETNEEREREAREIISRVDSFGPYWIDLGSNGPQVREDEIQIQKLNLKDSVYEFGQNEQDSNQEFQVRSEIHTLLHMGASKLEIQDLVNWWRYLGNFRPPEGAVSVEDKARAHLQGQEVAKPSDPSKVSDLRLEEQKRELVYRLISNAAFTLGKNKQELGQADISDERKKKLTDDSEYRIYEIQSNLMSEIDRVTGSAGEYNFDETGIGKACRQ